MRQGILHAWKSVVLEVEQGYKFDLEDYENDLDARSILQKRIDAGELMPAQLEKVAEWDRRFLDCTEDWPELRVRFQSDEWWIRKPKRIHSELVEQVKDISE